jgi:DNA-binding transcriptional regulator YiaG
MQDANMFDRIVGLATRGETLPPLSERQRIRRAAGVTQAELADVLGVHSVTVSRWENGSLEPSGRKLVDYRVFLTIAQSNERRSKMSTIRELLELPEGMLLDGTPPEWQGVYGDRWSQTRVEPLLAQLEALALADAEIVVAEEGVVRQGGFDTSAQRLFLQALVTPRRFATCEIEETYAEADSVQTGIGVQPAPRGRRVTRVVERYAITPRGRDALERIEALSG